jgi:hypothetical protein
MSFGVVSLVHEVVQRPRTAGEGLYISHSSLINVRLVVCHVLKLTFETVRCI